MKVLDRFSRETQAAAHPVPFQGNKGIEADQIRQWALLLAPPLLIGSMWGVFRGCRALLGEKLGYFTAFVSYWLVWCLAFPLWIMRGRGLVDLFRRTAHPLGKPAWLGLFLLLFPAIGAALTVFPRRLRLANPLIILTSAALAVVNATTEEVLWRGIYSRVFAREVVRGYLYPAVGFALWHLVPLSVHKSEMGGGPKSFLAGAFFIGLGHGWIAWHTQTLRWTVLTHTLTDFLGFGSLMYFGPQKLL